MRLTSRLAAAAARLLHDVPLRTRVLARAGARDRAMILLYHRLVPDGTVQDGMGIVPCVPAALFRAQLEALRTVADVVPLAALAAPGRGRLRVAITFDDDEPSHAALAAPALREAGLPATFFLCGRALHELPPAWWLLLEAQVAARGVQATAAALGVTADSAAALAAACEGTPLTARIERAWADGTSAAQLSAAAMTQLAQTPGVAIGFHTVRHAVLPLLDDAMLTHDTTFGRDALARAAGVPVTHFAYPHGKVDARAADAVRAAGYAAAVASGQRPVTPRSEAFMLSRWEPGAMAPETLLAHLAMRVSLPAP